MNLSIKLKQVLHDDFWSIINIIGKYADLYNVNAFIIGGVVRDILLDKAIFDIDIVVEGNAVSFCKFLEEKEVVSIIRIATDFGTAKVKFVAYPNYEIDFASTRTESYPRAGHLPVIEKIGCSLQEDILRRDFSVNALAIQINKRAFGEIVDYTGGLNDISKKELKILHEKSFIDDPTRIIRGLRFVYKLGFSLEEKTKILQKQYLDNFYNEDICYERIKQVIRLAFNLNSADLLNDFIQCHIYKLLGTNIRKVDILRMNNILSEKINLIDKENIWLVYFASFLTYSEAKKFNLTSKEMQVIKSLENLLQQNIDTDNNFEIYNLFKNEPIEAIIAYCSIEQNNVAQKYLSELKDIKSILNGKDLINMGLSEGKIVGEILNKLLENKLNGKLLTKKEEVKFIQDNFLDKLL